MASIVDPLDCAFGWVNTNKESRWVTNLGDVNFRYVIYIYIYI